MSKKYVIVGGVAGGASTAARLRRLDEMAEIVMFEKGPHVSFSNCCLPYRLSEKITSHERLVLMQPEKFHKQYNITARVNSEVIAIDRAAKCVTVREANGNEYSEAYDKLILAPGANAIVPPLEGHEGANVFIVKNVVDIAALYDYIHAPEHGVKNITVVGGGFIGVETAENLQEAGFTVTLIEAMPQIMRPFDEDMVQILHKELTDHGIQLVLGKKAMKYQGNDMVLEDGTVIAGDAVVMAIGVKPDTALAASAGLALSPSGHIEVTPNWATVTDPDVYAVGDAALVHHAITNTSFALPLAGPAQKQARQAANHIYGTAANSTGYIGSSCIQVFGYNGAATGLTMAQCAQFGIKAEIAYIIPQDKVGLMPGACPFFFKVIFETPTGKILGAQAISKGDAAKRVDIVATLIKHGGTLADMADLELCYAPPFSTAKDPTNMAAYVGLNLLAGAFRQVTVDKVRELVEAGAYILDVREVPEYNLSHIKGAVNIPLSELRTRMGEIPTDKPVYVHCRSAQRSYNACLALQAHGYTQAYNVSGGFLGLSFFEAFHDAQLGRAPIVTDYNFN